ncbi:MAG: glycosyltransferase [Flavobacteriales bacterium]|nr:glycosyltransferase [Flavobacteriales bacterium]
MRFSITTPSFGQLAFLRLNAASVADQRSPGVEVEHLVQDGGSRDGTAEWLATRPDINGLVEPDDGMYDAINRGIRRGSGDVHAWLNCDEQYLPGALAAVADHFLRHPEVDILIGHTVVVDEEGRYLCHRKAVIPTPGILKRGRLPLHSSSLFFRRHLVHGPRGGLFDPAWKAMGDWAWICAVLQQGARIEVHDAFLSTFTDTGGNLGMSPRAREEMSRVKAGLSPLDHLATPIVRGVDYMRKALSGYYRQRPFDYVIYRPDPSTPLGVSHERRVFHVDRPTVIWKGHMLGT